MDEPDGPHETLLLAPTCSSMQELNYNEDFDLGVAMQGFKASQGESHNYFMGRSSPAPDQGIFIYAC